MKFKYHDTATVTGGFYKGHSARIGASVFLGLMYVVTIDPDNVWKSRVATIPFWNLKG